MDPDPDPGGSKSYGSPTLVLSNHSFLIIQGAGSAHDLPGSAGGPPAPHPGLWGPCSPCSRTEKAHHKERGTIVMRTVTVFHRKPAHGSVGYLRPDPVGSGFDTRSNLLDINSSIFFCNFILLSGPIRCFLYRYFLRKKMLKKSCWNFACYN